MQRSVNRPYVAPFYRLRVHHSLTATYPCHVALTFIVTGKGHASVVTRWWFGSRNVVTSRLYTHDIVRVDFS